MAKRKRPASKRRTPTKLRALPTLADLCKASDDFLRKVDIGGLNLMCAGGLPGAEKIDIGKALGWLDEAARQVDIETRRHWYRFNDSPETYNNSPGYFRCYFLLQVLQEDFAVRYNPVRVRDASFQDPKCIDPDFRDSRDLFIHGIIDGPGGTCASMPVLYVAVGRRLGYPLKLVEARGHLFCRWDNPLGIRFGVPERFNVEGAGYGIGSFPDEYYKTWPERWTAAEEVAGCYLKSFSPREELAAFLCTRGECLADNGRLDEAIQAYQWACGLLPNELRYRRQLMRLVWKTQRRILELQETLALNRPGREGSRRLLFSPQNNTQSAAATRPHGDYCQCWHCRQARQASQRRGPPGHPPRCPCLHANSRKNTRTAEIITFDASRWIAQS